MYGRMDEGKECNKSKVGKIGIVILWKENHDSHFRKNHAATARWCAKWTAGRHKLPNEEEEEEEEEGKVEGRLSQSHSLRWSIRVKKVSDSIKKIRNLQEETQETGVNQLVGDQLTSELASQIANELHCDVQTAAEMLPF